MPESWRVLSDTLITGNRGDLRRGLVDAVRREGEPTVRAVRAGWLSIEVASSRGGHVRPDVSTGLRQRVAAATRVTATRTGVQITVNGRAIDPAYGSALAWYLNASGRPWRHPVFGRRANANDWQVQRGREVFFSTVRAHQPTFRAAIAAAMERTAREF
jgi:hypothetical protein